MFNADDLKKEFLADIESAASEIQLSDVWKKYLSKTGSVQKLMNGIKAVFDPKNLLNPHKSAQA